MGKVFIGLMVSVGLWAIMPSTAMAGCNPDPCPEGQTCRYEQPNTYYCKSYNNVSGSQGAFDQQGSAMPRGPQLSAPNKGTAGQSARMGGAVGVQKASDCAGSYVACVDVQINDSPYSVPSVFAAVELVLQKRLEGQRIFSLNVQPNEAAMRLVQGQMIEVGNALSSLMNHRFVEQPDLPEIMNLKDLMPPPDFLNRIDPMTGSALANLNAMYGTEAMQAAMADLERIAKASGGSWFFALLFSAEAAQAITVIAGSIAIYDYATRDEEEGKGGTTIIVQPGATVVIENNNNEIIAETEGRMLINAYEILGNSLLNLTSMRGMY